MEEFKQSLTDWIDGMLDTLDRRKPIRIVINGETIDDLEKAKDKIKGHSWVTLPSGGIRAADNRMKTVIAEQVRQDSTNDKALGDVCPRESSNSSFLRPEPRLNTEHRTLNTPIRNPFRMGSHYEYGEVVE